MLYTINTKDFDSDKELEKQLEEFHNILRTNANEVIGKVNGINMVDKDEIKDIPTIHIQATPLVNFFHKAYKGS